MIPDEKYGRMGYEEYAVSTGGKTYDGRDMPKWDALPERIRTAWCAAVSKVLDAYAESQ